MYDSGTIISTEEQRSCPSLRTHASEVNNQVVNSLRWTRAMSYARRMIRLTFCQIANCYPSQPLKASHEPLTPRCLFSGNPLLTENKSDIVFERFPKGVCAYAMPRSAAVSRLWKDTLTYGTNPKFMRLRKFPESADLRDTSGRYPWNYTYCFEGWLNYWRYGVARCGTQDWGRVLSPVWYKTILSEPLFEPIQQGHDWNECYVPGLKSGILIDATQCYIHSKHNSMIMTYSGKH